MIGKHATSMADKLCPFSGARFSYDLCRLMGELRR